MLYTRLSTGQWQDADIVVYDLDAGTETTVVERGIYGRYVPTGHVLYATGTGTIMALPFDLADISATGDPFPVQSDVRIAHWGGGASFAVSDSGIAAFVHGSNLARRRIWWTDRAGQRLRAAGSPAYVIFPNLSPDGRRLAMDVSRPEGTSIWVADVATGDRERFTLGDAYVFSPVWSPDGTRIAYVSYGAGREAANNRIFIQAVDGGDPAVVYEAEPGESLWLSSWSPDDRWLAIATTRTGATDLYALDLEAEQNRIPVAATTADEFFAQFSPDGRWLAYESNETGQNEVFVVSFPELRDRRQLSTGGGTRPRWSAAGDEVFYWTPGKALVARTVSTEGRLTWEEPHVLFEAADVDDTPAYTVSPDGQELQIVVVNEDSLARRIHVVTNWLEEVRRLAASN